MERSAAIDLIDEAMYTHLQSRDWFGGWTWGWNTRVTAGAVTKFRGEVIEFSTHYVDAATPEQLLNTVLHEIAHAIVGPGEGHGAYWRSTHIALGGDGSRCHDVQISRDVYPIVADCDCSRGAHYRTRMPRKGYFHTCRESGKRMEWRRVAATNLERV